MKNLVKLTLLLMATASAGGKEEPFAVVYSVSVANQTFPTGIAKIGKTGTASSKSKVLSPKVEPPLPDLGWAMEITPVRDKADNFIGKIIIRNTTMKIDEGEFPVTASTESVFRFSLPIDGVSHTKNLLGLGKVTLKLELVDAVGTPVRTEQAGTGQPATRSESKSEGGDKPQPEAEGRSR